MTDNKRSVTRKSLMKSLLKTFFPDIFEEIRLNWQKHENLKSELDQLIHEVERLQREVNLLNEKKRREDNEHTLHHLRERGTLSRRIICLIKKEIPKAAPLPERAATLDECFRFFEKEAPEAFSIWKKLFEANRSAYEGCPIHSCSMKGHPMASYFRDFLAPWLGGTVLDIGCGPQPVPSYLEPYPHELIAGIDPLQPSEKAHPFTFQQGFCEFLPWEDDSFDTVVAATSLDHVFLLEKALKEVARVLKDDGIFIVWVAFNAGAARYDPCNANIKAIDEYHLFHFDKSWFEEVVGATYTIEESVHLTLPDISSFYALSPKKTP
ncbi:MAG: methyltransferase domain-containing protein [Candidatus Xenobiia bacterium LiM19]